MKAQARSLLQRVSQEKDAAQAATQAATARVAALEQEVQALKEHSPPGEGGETAGATHTPPTTGAGQSPASVGTPGGSGPDTHDSSGGDDSVDAPALRAQVKELTTQLTASTSNLDALRTQLTTAEAAGREAEAKAGRMTRELAAAEDELTQARLRCDALAQAVKQAQAEAKHATQQAEKAVAEATRAAEAARVQASASLRRAQAADKDAAMEREAASVAREAMQRAQEGQARAEQRVTTADAARDGALAECQVLQQRLDAMSSELDARTHAATHAAGDVGRVKAEMVAVKALVREQSEQITALTAAKVTLQSEIDRVSMPMAVVLLSLCPWCCVLCQDLLRVVLRVGFGVLAGLDRCHALGVLVTLTL